MMNTIADLFMGAWSYAFGWTLVHSLWQSVIIFLLVRVCLRLIPVAKSSRRYAIASSGLFLLLAVSVSTFSYLMSQGSGTVPTGAIVHEKIASDTDAGIEGSGVLNSVSAIASAIQQNMHWILSGWMAGFLIFAVRLTGGLLYTHRLRSTAVPLENEWSTYIYSAGRKVGINRLVSLAESAMIATPMVIGYLRPVVLVPVGIFTGLSTGQLETIFLHELAHIKRHDQLINFMQTVIETVLFFNPFAWSLSGLIRREREYCCDDLVILQHGSARTYAEALVQLAETRFSSQVLALSLAENKNQLLNRIRRIMEKSVKPYSGKGRIVLPAVLLIAGLFCISWLGIQGDDGHKSDFLLAEQDTIPTQENSAQYSRKSINTLDEDGQPHEEIIEEFRGDEDLRPLLEKGIPSIPDIPSRVLPPGFAAPGFPRLPMAFDTIPPPLNFNDFEAWEEFSKNFEERFTMDFENLSFFRDHDPIKFMEELENRFGIEGWKDQSTPFHFNLPPETFQQFENFPDAESFKALEQNLQRLEEFHWEHLRNFEREFESDRMRHMGRFQDVLRQQLIEDGYLAEDESIQTLEWDHEIFKVNGKQIKPEDEAKYRDVNNKYLNRRPLDKLE